jgi:DNA sulfur modification protein DndB
MHRDLRGIQGITTRQRRIQQALRTKFSDFNPPGLDEFLRDEKSETNKKAKAVLDEIELLLQENVIAQLKEEYGLEGRKWWFEGIPPKIREEVSIKFEQDGGARLLHEKYFDLLHYRAIIQHNWEDLQGTFASGKKGVGKDKGTAWIQEINNHRKAIAHVTSGITITQEQLSQIEQYRDWLKLRIDNPEEEEAEAQAEKPED